ncbi:MAG: tRNA (adenosine(37)-N6)-threonylcarbamoyltransferase complex transferase subunit TsaD, partial [bacterium]|nr:tRNA (adenosine(37)-N6)-threonylcarbamoyltransferase complex transferase subunit TsaD [bacterium]
PIISELAKEGAPKYQLPVPMIRSLDLNFSFSGLKTACLYKLKKLPERDRRFFCDFSASFVGVVAKALMIKLEKAIKIYRPAQIFLGGGVISNLKIRKEARKVGKKFGLRVFVPYNSKFLTDNAAMIGVCAYFKALRGDFVKDVSSLDRQPNLGFSK